MTESDHYWIEYWAEIQEGTQDDHRFNQTYLFQSDTLPVFKGSV